jgi:hypothetical protein
VKADAAPLPGNLPIKPLGVFDGGFHLGGGIVLAVRDKPVAVLWRRLTRWKLEQFFAPDGWLLPHLFPLRSARHDWCAATARVSILAACARLGPVEPHLLVKLGVRRGPSGRVSCRATGVGMPALSEFPSAAVVPLTDRGPPAG